MQSTKSTQMSATYEVNGLTVGYAYASADATDANDIYYTTVFMKVNLL